MNDHDDRLLDVFLEESFGGVQPPDVSAKVLRSLAERTTLHQAMAQPTTGPRPIPLAAPLVTANGEQPTVPVQITTPPRSTRRAAWLPLALAASLLLAIGGFWLSGRGGDGARQVPVAEQSKPPSEKQQVAASGPSPVSDKAPEETVVPPIANSSTSGNSASPAEPAAEVIAADTPQVAPRTPDLTESNPSDSPASKNPSADLAASSLDGPSLASALSSSATTDREIVGFINETIRRHCQQAGVRLSPRATDAEWCRRVYLDVIGRIPTIEELEAFLIDNARDKRARLVDLLLYSDGYVESHARFWTALWTNLLIGRGGGMEPGSLVNREALQQYLRRSIISGKAYDRLVDELVSAEGSNRPGDDDYNGAVNFLLAHLADNATPATAKTAQIFLGMQVRCTQCHNHPFNEWKQSRFWELNSFFRQTRADVDMTSGELRRATLANFDFLGEGGDVAEAEVYYEARNGQIHVAYPKFIDGTELPVDGRVAVIDRRRELARLITHSDELGRALVNRLWTHFLGYGFTKPSDDLGPHNPPSHPELVDRLAGEFARQGYDLKRLTRWIVLSEAYGLSSKFGPKLGNAADDPQTGTPPLFSHFYVRQMLPEQLYDSLLVATDAHLAETSYAEQQRLKDDWMRQFTIVFGTDENDEATTFDGTIAQTLVMMNGDLTRQAVSGRSGSFLAEACNDNLRREASGAGRQSRRADTVHQLYRAALARVPSKGELRVVGGLLEERGGDAVSVLQDIWWALLNSNEFILNH